jgi:hypothetical protein
VAGGSWAMTGADGSAFALELEQSYQDVTGTMSGQGQLMELGHGILRGKAFTFSAGGRAYAGTIEDAAMNGSDGAWRAVRTG